MLFNTRQFNEGTFNSFDYTELMWVDKPIVKTQGPLATHVTVKSDTDEYTANNTPEPAVGIRIERIVEIDTGDVAVCQTVAEQLLARWSVNQVSVTGIIALNVTLDFKKKLRIVLAWAGIDEDMILLKKVHYIQKNQVVTEITCGDFILGEDELLTRILATL